MKRLLFATLVFGLMLAGCSHARKAPPLKLYVFECGRVLVKDISLFSPGHDKGQSKELVASCYLIQHPKGTLMWDTGLPDYLASKADGMEKFGGAMRMKVAKPLATQLADLGVDPGKVDYVAFSHMHMDHSGNGNLFSGATVLIQKEEYAAAFGKDAEKMGFEPANYEKLKANKAIQLDGDHDVFGDGSVVILRAPGHTPGHQALYLNLPKSGPLVLSGDLYHFRKNREHKRMPSFNFDKEQTLASMEKIEKFTYDKGARFWIQHDPDQNQEIAHAPAYHE